MKRLVVSLIFFSCGITGPAMVWGQNSNVNDQLSFNEFVSQLDQASPGAQILDARSTEEYLLNHLKGAVNINNINDAELQQRLKVLDKKRPVFVYSINNGRSGVLAKKLRDQHFRAVYELPGGISKWIGSGKEVESTVSKGMTLAEYNTRIQSDKLVLVDVHSRYCGACKKLSPVVDSVVTSYSGALGLVKIELFDNRELGKDLKIESIPTLLLYKGNKIVWRNTGLTSKTIIDDAIKSQLKYQ